MAFWGIEVKPGKPYTHSSKHGRGRLRISQATLAIGSATIKSVVQCNVGDKSPVLLCALLPDKTESLQLDLEFDEAEDVMFSVIGPRGVYLTGYYVGHNHHSNMQEDTESYGEDIANSGSQESNHRSDEDEYEDSFINDDEPDRLTPSPLRSSRDEDEYEDEDEDEEQYRKVNVNCGHKRLKKKYQSIVSDDDMSIRNIDDEDSFLISPLCTNTKNDNEKLQNGDSKVVDSKDEANLHLVNGKTEGKGDEPMQESKPKSKKKKQDSTNNVNDKSALDVVNTEGSPQVPIKEVKTKKKKKDHVKKSNTVKSDDDQKANDMGVDHEVLTSAEVVPEDNVKTKKKRKAGNKHEDNGNQSEEKKIKNKKQKTSKTHEDDENNDEEEGNKKTLSNGLVIEDLVTGKSKGKVAAPGKKVKVQYVVKLKENEKVIDSNEKSPYKFRLGDKEVIEGLNVGLEGMRVGDKRRLTIPPSMSLGYKGTGENIPPNSWLVYDVEMCSIH